MAGFSFPPPPPPPPKAAPQESSATNHAQSGAYGSRPGRGGGDRGRGRGRGRGNSNRGRGAASNTHAPPHQALHYNRAMPQQQHNAPSFNMPALPAGGYINPAFASMYTNALNSAPSAPQPWLSHTQSSQNTGHSLPRLAPSQKPQTKPKVQAAPSVPSFGFALDIVKPQAPSTGTSDASTSKKRKHNGLGLTPRSDIREDSEEDDADEEAKYSAPGGVLQFEYKGRSSTLKPEDIAAWIEERKKKFPTKNRIAQKKKEEEEAKEARRLARGQANAEYKSKHPQQERQAKKRKPNQDASEQDKAIRRAEKLREKLRKAEELIAKVKAKKESTPKKPKMDLGINYDSDDSAGPGSDGESSSLAESSSEVSTDSDSDDSSSSDDESDDDAPPEQESSGKRPMKVFLPNRKTPQATTQQPRRDREKIPPKRITLRERMVEQERRQEAERALQAIKFLGENGMLD